MINIDKKLLNKTSKELLKLLNRKDYKNSVKLINKEIRYLHDQNRRLNQLKKEDEQNQIVRYLYEKEINNRLEDLKNLKEIKSLVYQAKENPKAVRLNSSILKFSNLSQKNIVRKKNIKKSRTMKKNVLEKKKEAIEIFYYRGFENNKNFASIQKVLPRLNELLQKYIKKDFTTSLKESLEDVNPYDMSGDTEEAVYSVSEEFIEEVTILDLTESNEDEINEILSYLSLLIKK